MKKPKLCERCGKPVEYDRVLLGLRPHRVGGPPNKLLHLERYVTQCDDGKQPGVHNHIPYSVA